MTESATGSAADVSGASGLAKVREIIRYIPDGTTIPEEMWSGRHRSILIGIAVQVPCLIALGLYEGTESFTGA